MQNYFFKTQKTNYKLDFWQIGEILEMYRLTVNQKHIIK